MARSARMAPMSKQARSGTSRPRAGTPDILRKKTTVRSAQSLKNSAGSDIKRTLSAGASRSQQSAALRQAQKKMRSAEKVTKGVLRPRFGLR